jgi:hypothetical protein
MNCLLYINIDGCNPKSTVEAPTQQFQRACNIWVRKLICAQVYQTVLSFFYLLPRTMRRSIYEECPANGAGWDEPEPDPEPPAAPP